MISIRKLLTEDESQAPMLRAIHLLLQGIRVHMVEGAPADAQRFREDMNSVTRQVEEQHSPQAILTHAGTAVRTLRPEDRLFRWSGPALMALLPRANRIEIVREEMARVMDAPFEYTVQTASRGVLLPVTGTLVRVSHDGVAPAALPTRSTAS